MLVLRKVELPRALPPALLTHTGGRRSFGAALAFTLLFSSLFASAPAFAQTQEIVSEQINFVGLENVETIILGQLNDVTNANINTGPITEDNFRQLALITQSNSVVSIIPIDNGGDVNVAQLITGSQTNTETLTSLNDSGPADIFVFEQTGMVDQGNSVGASIAIGDSGEVNAGLTNSVSQTNTSEVAITNADTSSVSVVDSFRQSAEVTQSNEITSNIAVENSGSSTGISAAITNAGITQTNDSEIAVDSGGDVTPGNVTIPNSFTQFAKTSQSNKITSSIAVTNSGQVEAADTGIAATIINFDITQTNDSHTTVDSGGDVTADSFTQSVEVDQSNQITSSIAVENSGHVKGDNIGIAATIINGNITQTNDNEIDNNSTGDVTAGSSLQSAELNQSNAVDRSSIVITNSGEVVGGNVGILAAYVPLGTSTQTNTSSIQNLNVSDIPQSIVSFQDNFFGENDTITIVNSGNVFGGPNSDSVLGILAVGPIVDINNTGLVHAYAQGPDASATGIGVVAAETTITNRAGTIWAGFSTDDGSTIQRGIAIDTVNVAGLIQLQGTKADGHIFGDIDVAAGDTIDVTQGRTWFDGTINGKANDFAEVGTLDIHDGGKLVLCQEGWSNACDPSGWGSANWNPQNSKVAVDGPSFVNVDTFMVQSDGTVSYQLTPRSTPGTYPQVFANNVNILGGTLNAQYLPGFYANNTTYEEIIFSNTPINGAGTGVNGTGFGTVKDNSILLQTTAVLDENNQVDLNVTRTPFNQVSGLTKNEQAAGGGIEKIYGNLPGVSVNPATTNSFDQLVANLFTIDNAKDYATVIQELSGAQYAQQLQSVLFSLNSLNESITDRMDCNLNQPVTKVVADHGVTAQPYGCFTPGQVQAWARVWGGWNHNDGDVNAPSDNENQWGIWGGWDYALRDSSWFFGLAGGYFRSNMNFGQFGGVNGGSINYEGGQIAGYGGWDNRVWYDRAIVSGGFYSGESHRNFAFQSSPVDPSGHPDADAVSFYNEAGRRFWVEPNVTLTPFVGVSVMSGSIDSFTESDPSNTGAALRIGNSDDTQTSTLLGGRLNATWGLWRPEVAVAWQHLFDTTVGVNASFAQASGSTFKVTSSDIGSDGVLVDAGLAYAWGPNSDLSVRYVGQFLDNYDSNSVMGRWTWKWGGAPVAAPLHAEAAPLK